MIVNGKVAINLTSNTLKLGKIDIDRMPKSTKRSRSIPQESLEDSLRRRYALDILAITQQDILINNYAEPITNVK